MALTAEQRLEVMAHLQRALACTSDYVQHALPRSKQFDRQRWFGADLAEMHRVLDAFEGGGDDSRREPEHVERAEMIAYWLSEALEGIEIGESPERIRRFIASGIRCWADGIEEG